MQVRTSISLAFTLALISALAGCGRAGDNAAPAAPTAAPTAAPSAAPPPQATAAPAPQATPAPAAGAQNAYMLAATGSGFSTGPMMSAHTVYVFFDTTCPHCAHLWANAQTVRDKLKIVWMPIGLLRPQSLPQGATILAAADPAATMAQNESSVINHGNGISAIGTIDEAVVAKVKANTELFKKFDADSVPLIVYRNAKTGEVGQHNGVVEAAELLAFAGL